MKLSVALCTYNGEKFIQEQLDSILDQTMLVNEIIICDDCSTDNTINILESFAKKAITIFEENLNVGVVYGDATYFGEKNEL